MKIPTSSFVSVFFLFLLMGCDIIIGKSEYDHIGNYKTRVEAKNKAIKRFVEKYNLLTNDKYYKIKYAIPDAPLNEQRENAVWYHKGNATLVYEDDVSSGPFCTWKEVTRSVLEEASKSANSFAKIDSLTKPMQNFRECQ